jgi:hypothetical protein
MKRWKYWKYKFDKKLQSVHVDTLKIANTDTKVLMQLRKDKKFLEGKLGLEPSLETITAALQDRRIVKWVTLSRLSPYYLLLSPFVQETKDYKSMFATDLGVHSNSITEKVKTEFKNLFPEQFQ